MTHKRPPEPPAKWCNSAKKFWKTVHQSYEVDEPQTIALLTAACQQLHRADEAKVAVDADGAILKDRFGQERPHPGIDVERKAHMAFLRLARELGLDIEVPAETRGRRRVGTGV